MHFRGQIVRIDFHLSVALPLLLLQFHHQVHPLVGQFPKALVAGDLLPYPGQALGAHETSTAFAAPGETELVIGSVLLRILGVFATAACLAAYVVLLAQAAWMHRPEFDELLLQVLDLAFNLGNFHESDTTTVLSELSSLFFPKVPTFFVFFGGESTSQG